MNMLQEHIREYINPYPNRYTRGKWEIRVLPHEDLDDDCLLYTSPSPRD